MCNLVGRVNLLRVLGVVFWFDFGSVDFICFGYFFVSGLVFIWGLLFELR